MFQSARITLTLWYVVIFLTISGTASLLFYARTSRIFELEYQRIEARFHRQFPTIGQSPAGFGQRWRLFLAEDLTGAKRQLAIQLLRINGAMAILIAAAGYFLSGKTLRPIEQAMEEQKRFVADASHELRTPLSALKTSIEVALRDKRLNKRQAKAILKESLGDIDQLGELSGKLLILSRLQNGNHHVFGKINAKKLVEKSMKKVLPIAKKKNLQMKSNLQALSIEADGERLEEMLVIFLDNAIKFTPKKGSVSVSLRKNKKHAIFEIADTGIGIPKEHLGHIFDRFFRVDRSRSKQKVDGFGLGLSLAKQIIDTHSGTVDVKSSVGKGSSFTVKLPLRHS